MGCGTSPHPDVKPLVCFTSVRSVDQQERELPLFSWDRVLPVGQALSVNTDCLVISLVSTTPVNGNPILLQSLLTEQQLRVLLPLLKWPCYCSHELNVKEQGAS